MPTSMIGMTSGARVVPTVTARLDQTVHSEIWEVRSTIRFSLPGKLLTLADTTVQSTERSQADIAQLHRYCADCGSGTQLRGTTATPGRASQWLDGFPSREL